MTRRISIRAARVLPAVIAAGVLVPVVAGAAPASAATTPQVTCTSDKAGLAAKLQKDITAALASRKGTVAVGLHDRTTNTTCTLRATSSYDSASVVKVTVLATLLWDAKKTNRYLTTREANLATAMITKSDNTATTSLWKQLGTTKVKGFLKAAGMTRTVPGSGGYWGLTQINVQDEQKLLSLVTAKNSVLSDNSRAYILKLMGEGRLVAAVGHPGRCALVRRRARQERLAAALHARLARAQHRRVPGRRTRLHDLRPDARQQHDELRRGHHPGRGAGHTQGPDAAPPRAASRYTPTSTPRRRSSPYRRSDA